MKGKYKKYRMKVVTPKGDVRYRTEEGLDHTSYSDMLNFYRREKYKYTTCTISFIGVTHDDIQETIFEKQPSCDSSQYKDARLDKSINELAQDIEDIIDLILLKQKYHNEMIYILEKRNNLVMHRVESFTKKEWNSEEDRFAEKLAIFDMIADNRDERRIHKDEIYKIEKLLERVNLRRLKGRFKVNDWKSNVNIEYLDEKKVDELKMIEEFPYETDRERINMIKRLSKEYSKVRTDYKNKVLVCYNTYKGIKKQA